MLHFEFLSSRLKHLPPASLSWKCLTDWMAAWLLKAILSSRIINKGFNRTSDMLWSKNKLSLHILSTTGYVWRRTTSAFSVNGWPQCIFPYFDTGQNYHRVINRSPGVTFQYAMAVSDQGAFLVSVHCGSLTALCFSLRYGIQDVDFSLRFSTLWQWKGYMILCTYHLDDGASSLPGFSAAH